MPRADFYTLKDNHVDARYRVMHVLLEKSLKQGHKVHLHCRDKGEATSLDDYLWGYKLTAFIPHHTLFDQDNTMHSPVTLGFDDYMPAHQDLCINFSAKPITTFSRVIEIVIQETSILSQTRQHYRTYREHQFELNLHKI